MVSKIKKNKRFFFILLVLKKISRKSIFIFFKEVKVECCAEDIWERTIEVYISQEPTMGTRERLNRLEKYFALSNHILFFLVEARGRALNFFSSDQYKRFPSLLNINLPAPRINFFCIGVILSILYFKEEERTPSSKRKFEIKFLLWFLNILR